MATKTPQEEKRRSLKSYRMRCARCKMLLVIHGHSRADAVRQAREHGHVDARIYVNDARLPQGGQ